MIQTSSIANLRNMKQDEIWLVVRSVGKAKDLLKRPDVRHVPELSPTTDLFYKYLHWKQNGLWDQKCFDERYRPQFLADAEHSPEFQNAFSKLLEKDAKGKTITLACFCGYEPMCHRSILKELYEQARKENV